MGTRRYTGNVAAAGVTSSLSASVFPSENQERWHA